MNAQHNLGRAGEEIAADWLMKHGYRLLHINWSLHQRYELDIVAYRDDVIHFVEVKTRRRIDDVHGAPEQAVDQKKIRHISIAALRYLSHFGYPDNTRYQIDVMGIVYRDEGDYDVRWVEDVR